jgi:hypothetical protein
MPHQLHLVPQVSDPGWFPFGEKRIYPFLGFLKKIAVNVPILQNSYLLNRKSK